MRTKRPIRDKGTDRAGRGFAELDRVSLREEVLFHSERLPCGAVGTAVALWADGAAYEVEFTSPRPALVTVRGSALAKA